MIVTITLTVSGTDTGPFDLYSDLDSFTTAFDTNVSRNDLVAGYSATVPDFTNTIRVQSTGVCDNYIDVSVVSTTTTTSSTVPPPSTTTTTTTIAVLPLTQYCYVGLYNCGDSLHEIAGHEPFTGSVTYEDEYGASQTGYYCTETGTISIYSSSVPVTVGMIPDSCPTTTTTTTAP